MDKALAMQQLTGKAVSPGYAEGNAFVYSPLADADVPRYQIDPGQVQAEYDRFHAAIKRSYKELKQLERRVLEELGQAQSAIFSSHLQLLHDRKFTDSVKDRIARDLVNVEQAIDVEVADLCRLLTSLENEYIKERAHDVRDVGRHVMRQLLPTNVSHYVDVPPLSVIVARELLPSETIDLDREHVVAIVTEQGGENSHAAILARAMGIPAVTGVVEATNQITTGTSLLVDGEKGTVTITPTDVAVKDFSVLKQEYDDGAISATEAEKQDCVTLDGVGVTLLGNVNRPHELSWIAAHHLNGVGLFRTEFMFMDSTQPPDADRQQRVYEEALAELVGRVLTVRTLDLGGDKLPAFLTLHHETNPNLGLRGLRFSLAEQTMFDVQLRAILSASQNGEGTRVLFPMVLGASDLQSGVDRLRSIAANLAHEKIPPVGAMIETPAALFALDEILQIADFVSVGTNDLTQFMLAADRNEIELADDYSVLHPSVLRAIHKVVEACRHTQSELCVCGEAAGDPETACLLVGMGVRQLSMSPLRAARVRQMLRRTTCERLQALAQDVLHASSHQTVRRLIDSLALEHG
jgi:phosphoenolpyruvate-protein phosphotransferase